MPGREVGAFLYMRKAPGFNRSRLQLDGAACPLATQVGELERTC